MASTPPLVSDADEDIIQDLVTLQQMPVMTKLQVLLRSICTRLSLQGSKLDKAEEQGRMAALLKEELENLSKAAALKAEKEAEQNKWSKLIEDRLKGLDDIAKNYGDVMAGLQGVDLSILQSLPARLSAIEENTQGFNEGKDLSESKDSGSRQFKVPINERMESLQASFDDQNERMSRLEDQIKELKSSVQGAAKAYSSDIESLQKICRNLRSDIEMQPILDVTRGSITTTVCPDIMVAVNEIQSRLQRKADSETVDQLVRSTTHAKEGLEKMKTAYDELRKQMRSMRMPPSRRTSSADSNTRDGDLKFDITTEEKLPKSVDDDHVDGRLKYLEEEIRSMASQLRSKADRKCVDGLQIQMSLLGERQHDVLSPGIFSSDGVSIETEKVNQVTPGVPNDQGSEQVPVQKEQTPDTVSPTEFAKIKSSYIRFQVTLQKLQEMISMKADRDEVLQVHESMKQQSSDGRCGQLPASFDNEKYKSLMLELDNINDKIEKLEERSDLNVLVSKRLENFSQPAATIQETSPGLDVMKDAINEHASRMMGYADTLLQMEAMLASKADAAGLQALKASILELKRRNKELQAESHPSSREPSKEGDAVFHSAAHLQGEGAVRAWSEDEKFNKHEMMLNKLIKDMELLGAGILTLSGHDKARLHEKQTETMEAKDHRTGGSVESSSGDGIVHVEINDGVTVNQPSVGPIENHPISGSEGERHGDDYGALSELQGALHENLIKPKGDAEVVNKLAEDIVPLSVKMNELDVTIRCLKDNTAEKDELQKMKSYMKKRLDFAETAMLSGRGLPGFKCMSCAHRLEKLNPNRANFLPTNCMRRQVLPMHAAERLYHKEGDHDSPRNGSPTWENQNKTNNEAQAQIIPLGKSKPMKKK